MQSSRLGGDRPGQVYPPNLALWIALINLRDSEQLARRPEERRRLDRLLQH